MEATNNPINTSLEDVGMEAARNGAALLGLPEMHTERVVIDLRRIKESKDNLPLEELLEGLFNRAKRVKSVVSANFNFIHRDTNSTFVR